MEKLKIDLFDILIHVSFIFMVNDRTSGAEPVHFQADHLTGGGANTFGKKKRVI